MLREGEGEIQGTETQREELKGGNKGGVTREGVGKSYRGRCPDKYSSKMRAPRPRTSGVRALVQMQTELRQSPASTMFLSPQATLKAQGSPVGAQRGRALTSCMFSLLACSGSGVASRLFLSNITGVPSTFRYSQERRRLLAMKGRGGALAQPSPSPACAVPLGEA